MKLQIEKKKISEMNNINKDKEKLHNEIKNLKNDIVLLKSNNEKLQIPLKQKSNNNKDENNIKQNEQKAGLEGRGKSEYEVNILKTENEILKKKLIQLSTKMNEEYNDLLNKYNALENIYNQQINNKAIEYECKMNFEQILSKELSEEKNEIDINKKKNSQFIQLEEKKIKDNKNLFYYSEEENKSNYEEEFDLRKIEKRANDKDQSQDKEIDLPEITEIKEKYRKLDFSYNSLEILVKKILLTNQMNQKHKTYVRELCNLIGFDLETTNKILANSNN